MLDEIKKSNYTEEQIVFALKLAELGPPISELLDLNVDLESISQSLGPTSSKITADI